MRDSTTNASWGFSGWSAGGAAQGDEGASGIFFGGAVHALNEIREGHVLEEAQGRAAHGAECRFCRAGARPRTLGAAHWMVPIQAGKGERSAIQDANHGRHVDLARGGTQ